MGGKIGEDYEIPYMSISEAQSVMSTVVNKWNGHISRKALADQMNMTATGGGFYFKLNRVLFRLRQISREFSSVFFRQMNAKIIR